MREVLHIFLKDSRYLRLPIGMLAVWLLLYVYANATTLRVGDFPWTFGGFWYLVLQYWNVGLAIGWTYLIAQAVHADGPAGHRQFWLTRPYRRWSLILAKALFVLAYITLPFTLTQAAIIVLMGLPLGSHVPGIVVTQLMWLAAACVPIAAVAALTSTLPQALLVGLVVPLVAVVPLLVVPLPALRGLGPTTWVGSSVMIGVAGCVAALVIVLQVYRRRTDVSWLVALLGIIVMHGAAQAVSWESAYAFQASLKASESLTVSGMLAAPDTNPNLTVALEPAQYRLPFTVDGLAPDTLINCDGTQVSLLAPSGQRLSAPVRQANRQAATEAAQGCSDVFSATSRTLAPFLDTPVTVEATVYVTVFDDPQWTELGVNRPPVLVPHVGLCRLARNESTVEGEARSAHVRFECYRAMRRPSALITFAQHQGGRDFDAPFPDYSAWPGNLVVQPVTVSRTNAIVANTTDTAWVATRQIRAHTRIVVRQEGVTLSDYQIRRAP